MNHASHHGVVGADTSNLAGQYARNGSDLNRVGPGVVRDVFILDQVAGFQDIHTGKIEEIMLIKQTGDIDTFKQMYGIDGEIPKVY